VEGVPLPIKIGIGDPLSASPANKRCHSPDGEWYLKTKPLPDGSGSVCLIVELEGVEPSSTPGDHMFSTCLVLLDCREKPGAKHPSLTLAP